MMKDFTNILQNTLDFNNLGEYFIQLAKRINKQIQPEKIATELYSKKDLLNKIFNYFTLLSIVFFFLSINLNSQTTRGGYSESYLLRDVGTRAIGMGGAFSAVSDDATAIFYNPAGLAWLTPNPMFNSTVSVLDFGRTQSTLAWGQTVTDEIGVGIGINTFRTGSFVARDIFGNSLGSCTDWHLALTAGAGYRFEFASFGIAAKYLYSSLGYDDASANGFAVDIGSKFNVMDMFTFALCIQNASALMMWGTESEETNMLPYRIKAGFAWEFSLEDISFFSRSTVTGESEEISLPSTRYVLFGLDAVLTQHDNNPSFVLGMELIPHEVIAFRGGLTLLGEDEGKYKILSFNTWGAGLSIRPIIEELPFKAQIDYSISNDYLSTNKLGHHVAISLEF